MSIIIPGAEYAPILTRTVIDLGPEGSEFQIEREIRWRADCCDPDDMRAIWRLAAREFGMSEQEAAFAVLQITFIGETARCWTLMCPMVSQAWRRIEIKPLGARPDLAHATAALCRAVWGPR